MLRTQPMNPIRKGLASFIHPSWAIGRALQASGSQDKKIVPPAPEEGAWAELLEC